MKTIRFMKTTLVLLALFMAGSLNTEAQRGARGGYGYNGYNRTNFQNNLNLSNEQIEKMEDMRLVHYKAMSPLRDEMFELRARMRTLQNADKPDIKTINANIDKINNLQSKIDKKMLAHRLEMRSLLTDEQIVLLNSRRAGNFGPGRRAGHGYGQGNGYGRANGCRMGNSGKRSYAGGAGRAYRWDY